MKTTNLESVLLVLNTRQGQRTARIEVLTDFSQSAKEDMYRQAMRTAMALGSMTDEDKPHTEENPETLTEEQYKLYGYIITKEFWYKYINEFRISLHHAEKEGLTAIRKAYSNRTGLMLQMKLHFIDYSNIDKEVKMEL